MGASVFKSKKKTHPFLINYKTRSQIYFVSQLTNCKTISIVVTVIFLFPKAGVVYSISAQRTQRTHNTGFISDHSIQHRQELLSSE